MQQISDQNLQKFLKEALNNCYLGAIVRAEVTERKGFFEMEYYEKDLNYRDSFVGFYRSSGQEIIRY